MYLLVVMYIHTHECTLACGWLRFQGAGVEPVAGVHLTTLHPVFNIFLFYVYGCFACIYVCVALCVCSAWGIQKWVSDPLELELQMVLSVSNHPSGKGSRGFNSALSLWLLSERYFEIGSLHRTWRSPNSCLWSVIVRGAAYLCPPPTPTGLRLQVNITTPGFSIGAKDPSSDPPARVAGPLSSEPSPVIIVNFVNRFLMN